MFRVTITFRVRPGQFSKAESDLWAVSREHCCSGQLVGPSILTGDGRRRLLRLTGVMHERTSLDERHGIDDSRKHWADLLVHVESAPRVRIEPLVEGATCRCRWAALMYSPSSGRERSPLVCTTCGWGRPFYRFAHRAAGCDLLSVESEWQGAYRMWLNSSAETERVGFRLLADPDSPLACRGRAAVAAFSAAVRVPIYYELLTYHERGDAQRTICPGCGAPWDTSNRIAELACHRCMLAAQVPSDSSTPPRWWRPLPRHRRCNR